MSNKHTSLIKDIFIFGLGNLGSKLILFLMVPLYTNFLSTEEYGITELVYTFSQLIIPFVSVVIFDGIVRFGLAKEKRKEDVLGVGLFVVLLGSAITLMITPLVGLYQPIGPWKWYLCFYIIFNMLLSVEQNYLKITDQNLLFSLVAIFQTLALALLNVLFLCVHNMGVSGYLWAMLGSHILAVLIPLFFGGILPAIKRANPSKRLALEMLKYSAPLIVNNISWWIIHSSDKIMIEIMIGEAALGIYTVATKIPSLINVITSIFQQAWGISSIKEIESSNDHGFYAEVFHFLQVFVCGVAICVIFVLEPFMHVYVGEGFTEATLYIPLLLVSAAFAAVAGFWGTMYGALKKSVNSTITTFIAAIVNIVVNYVLILQIGLWGAVIGTVVAHIVLAIVRMLDVKRYLDIKVHLFSFIMNSLLILSQAILVAFGWNIYIVSAVVLALFVIVNFKSILGILKTLLSKLKR